MGDSWRRRDPTPCDAARHPTHRVTIDLDRPTPTHGAQELSFFTGHYDTWCYLPVTGFVSFHDEAEQYPCVAVYTARQRDRRRREQVAILRRVVIIGHHIREYRSGTPDGGFAHPAVLEFWSRSAQTQYLITMARRPCSSGLLKPECDERANSRGAAKRPTYRTGEVRYKAGKWPRLRRVIIKAEVVHAADKEPRDNPRFVITNMKQSPQWIYEHVYCLRGDIENRIKELHELDIDRTSCTSFWANQFRVLLTAAAYVLMQELRLRAAGTACARAQVGMLRERLLKLGARVLVSVRRVVVHLPASFPFLPTFRRVAASARCGTRLASRKNHELNRNISR